MAADVRTRSEDTHVMGSAKSWQRYDQAMNLRPHFCVRKNPPVMRTQVGQSHLLPIYFLIKNPFEKQFPVRKNAPAKSHQKHGRPTGRFVTHAGTAGADVYRKNRRPLAQSTSTVLLMQPVSAASPGQRNSLTGMDTPASKMLHSSVCQMTARDTGAKGGSACSGHHAIPCGPALRSRALRKHKGSMGQALELLPTLLVAEYLRQTAALSFTGGTRTTHQTARSTT